jgi:hypothetical protein
MDGHSDGRRACLYAKALLAEAGIPNGFKAKAEELNTSQQYLTAYQQIATDLAKIGVQMEMVSMTIPDLVGMLPGRAKTMAMMEICHDNPPGLFLLAENDVDGVHRRIKGYRVVQRHVQCQDLEIR